MTTNAHVTAENYEKFKEAANAAKNERSHLAGIFYLWQQEPGIEYALDSGLHRYDFEKCGTRYRTATVGFVVKASVETEPEETLHRYGFTKTGENTCGTYPQSGTVGAAMKAGAATEAATTHALYNFPECGANGYKATHGAAVVGTAIVGRAIVTSE